MLGGAGGFAIFSSTMSKTPVLPLFADDMGASPEMVGLIAAAATVLSSGASLNLRDPAHASS